MPFVRQSIQSAFMASTEMEKAVSSDPEFCVATRCKLKKLHEVFLLQLLLSMLWEQVTGIDFHPFCKMAVARNVTTCPDIPTFDILDADAFTGTWYEVGSTAQFKLSAEAGMSCPQVTYSLATTPHTGFNQGVVFNVLNSGVQVISPLAALEVHNINQGTKDICWNARDVCSMLASGSLQQSLAELAQVSSRVEEGSPHEASTLRAVQSKISTATENITLQLDELAYHMIDIQTHDGYLSQANGTEKSSIDEIKHAILQARQNKAAIIELVSQIANAREELIKVGLILWESKMTIEDIYAHVFVFHRCRGK
jgi:hypothetical protein